MAEQTNQDEMFEGSLAHVHHLATSIQNLRHLLEKMLVNNHAFDLEDQNWVRENIEKLQAEKTACEAELERRQHLYTNIVKKMETSLSARMKILEGIDSATGVLEENPELMAHLVRKQATLTDLLTDMKKGLLSPLDATADENQ